MGYKGILFRLKYKLGIAKEGKDFFTCGKYEWCKNCQRDFKYCISCSDIGKSQRNKK